MGNEGSGVSIPILGWFDEPAKKVIASVFDGLVKGTEARDIFHKYRNNHFARLKADLEQVKILGMSQPIRLAEIYSPSMVSTTIFGRLFEQDWLSAEHPQAPPKARRRLRDQAIRADKFIEEHNQVVVLGPAGSGKTTLLRHLALAYSDKQLFASSKLVTSRLPFYISLLSYAKKESSCDSIIEYISNQLRQYTDEYASHFVKRVLSKGLAVVILDSLDEVPTSLRDKVVADIRELCTGFPDCKIVVSSRTADYSPIHERFWEVELTRLTDDAVDTIVDAWFREQPDRAEELKQHLRRDEGVRSLCETPLLLSLLCIQFRHDLALPKRKTELYRRCVDAFLRDWDASRDFRRISAYSKISDDRKERMFEVVAGKFFADEPRYVFPEFQLVKHIGDCCELFEIERIEAAKVLYEIESHHGILERFSADSFMFSHPSIQEYFCARHLLAQRTEMAALKQHYKDERWSSVIEFVVSMHADPESLLNFLIDMSDMSTIKNFPPLAVRTRLLLLLYRCLASGAALTTQARSRMYDHVIDSHFQMSRAFVAGGVFPMALLIPGGVRHAYVYFHKRPTLHQALQPLRRLANEILLSPCEEYAAKVVERLRSLEFDGHLRENLATQTTALCLSVPIVHSFPREVRDVLDRVERSDNARLVSRFVSHTRDEMDRQQLA